MCRGNCPLAAGLKEEGRRHRRSPATNRGKEERRRGRMKRRRRGRMKRRRRGRMKRRRRGRMKRRRRGRMKRRRRRNRGTEVRLQRWEGKGPDIAHRGPGRSSAHIAGPVEFDIDSRIRWGRRTTASRQRRASRRSPCEGERR
jgi:hypothetical protein